MRPTNVRAIVGSRASGSSARPIVSVPPVLLSADARLLRAPAPAADSPPSASTTRPTRRRRRDRRRPCRRRRACADRGAPAQARVRALPRRRLDPDAGARVTAVALFVGLAVFGVFTGVAAGLLGVGGGTLMVPFLTLAIG